jgi:ubiquitin C-terminal hydrolase
MKNQAERKTLTRFRVSNHNLTIELDRYQKIPREERLCEICQSGEVEDGYYFANLRSCQ